MELMLRSSMPTGLENDSAVIIDIIVKDMSFILHMAVEVDRLVVYSNLFRMLMDIAFSVIEGSDKYFVDACSFRRPLVALLLSTRCQDHEEHWRR